MRLLFESDFILPNMILCASWEDTSGLMRIPERYGSNRSIPGIRLPCQVSVPMTSLDSGEDPGGPDPGRQHRHCGWVPDDPLLSADPASPACVPNRFCSYQSFVNQNLLSSVAISHIFIRNAHGKSQEICLILFFYMLQWMGKHMPPASITCKHKRLCIFGYDAWKQEEQQI